MARSNGPEVYRGRRKRLNVLGVVFGALAALILLTVVLFFGLQKYIVFEHDGVRVALPGAAAGEDGPLPNDETAPEQVNAVLEITDPDYSAVPAAAGEGLANMAAVFVPAQDVSMSGVGRYMSVMSSYGANALVLEVKPVSGQLVWASSSPTAAAYSLNGTLDLEAMVAALRQQDEDDELYLVAQLSCCIDGLLAERCPSAALRFATGAAYADSEGAWLDPYSATVSAYLSELCSELAEMGFDELLLKSLSLPITEEAIGFSVELSSTPTPEAAVCGLAVELTNALEAYDIPVSAILDTTSLRSGLADKSGQNLELFGKVFDRLCSATDSAWLSGVDRDSIDQYLTLGSLETRYVPIMSYVPEGYTSCIVQVPESVLPASDSGTTDGTAA